MLAALNKGKVNFRALAVMDSDKRGTVRFVPDDIAAATSVLEKINIRHEAADVLLVEVPSQQGGFRKICEKLAAEHLNIDYAYCSFDAGGKTRGGVLAVIKVNDDVNFKFGFLLQPQADWLQNPANDSYSQNLFLRRARLIVGGQVAKNVTFFFETDSPNLGKAGPTVTNGAKIISSGLIVQDAFLSWKLADEFTLDAGLILTGIAHNSLQSAASLMPMPGISICRWRISTPPSGLASPAPGPTAIAARPMRRAVTMPCDQGL